MNIAASIDGIYEDGGVVDGNREGISF